MKGFITIATGKLDYYFLAKNLLISYKINGNCDAPFAIIAEKDNEITSLFDTVIILDNPSCSYMDKIELLRHLPYDKNVFIDADSLIYNDVSFLLDMVQEGVTCFGNKVTFDEFGWFNKDHLGQYSKLINYNYQTHNGVLLLSNDSKTKDIYHECKLIAQKYSSFHFSMFGDPADEPIIALAMAVHNCLPLDRIVNNKVYGFLPTLRKVRRNITRKQLSYVREGNQWVDNVSILHWQTARTQTPEYKQEVFRLKHGDGILATLTFLFYTIKYKILIPIKNIF